MTQCQANEIGQLPLGYAHAVADQTGRKPGRAGRSWRWIYLTNCSLLWRPSLQRGPRLQVSLIEIYDIHRHRRVRQRCIDLIGAWVDRCPRHVRYLTVTKVSRRRRSHLSSSPCVAVFTRES